MASGPSDPQKTVWDFFFSCPTDGSILGYCIMIGKALLIYPRTVAVSFPLFFLFPVPDSGSKMSVSGYYCSCSCSYFLFPPASRFWSFISSSPLYSHYTTHISYLVLSISEIPQAAEDESYGQHPTCSRVEGQFFFLFQAETFGPG